MENDPSHELDKTLQLIADEIDAKHLLGATVSRRSLMLGGPVWEVVVEVYGSTRTGALNPDTLIACKCTNRDLVIACAGAITAAKKTIGQVV